MLKTDNVEDYPVIRDEPSSSKIPTSVGDIVLYSIQIFLPFIPEYY